MITVAVITMIEIDETGLQGPEQVKDAVEPTMPGRMVAIMSESECEAMLGAWISALEATGQRARIRMPDRKTH